MPELPDIEVYVDHLGRRILSQTLLGVRLASPFLLRSFDPPLRECAGRRVVAVRRMGKRIVVDLDMDLHLVLHLMIAGRLRWRPPGAKVQGKIGLAAFDFSGGTLVLTEASPKKRASLHVVRGEEGVRAHDRGGLEPLTASIEEFAAALRRERHTLKRALTDPRLFSGIGNAYSDEILWRARLSPVRLTGSLIGGDIARLREATRSTLLEWIDRLTRETGDAFPEGVTAFREEMAVHGRYRQPCPACGMPVQRIAYANNEADYCARCQTGGKLLADRGLSRLLKGDWPKTIEELEERKEAGLEKMRRPGAGDAKK
ncbi:MAG: Fpg/Nei family DNA glycosylase [Polyangiaceae bacterium]